MSIALKKDCNLPVWVITKTDTDGFQTHISVSREELLNLYTIILKTDI